MMARIYNRTTEKRRRQLLRREMPGAEKILWSKLRGRQMLGYKFDGNSAWKPTWWTSIGPPHN
jgi:very-short-patch-repair endonuclease